MMYLIGQILFCLLLAFILGCVLGWMVRSSAARQRESFLEEDLRVSRAALEDTEVELKRVKARVHEAEAERMEVSERCIQLEKTGAEQNEELDRCRAEIVELHESLTGKEQRITVLEKESRYWQKQVPLLQAEIGKQESSIEKLQNELKNKGERLPALESAMTDKEASLSAVQVELENLRREHADLRVSVQGKDKKIRSTELLLASQTSKTESALQAKYNAEAEAERLRQELADRRANTSAPPVQTAFADNVPDDDGTATESKLFSSPPQQRDNLKRIKGIGPKLEGMLNELGIYQFEQIAGFTRKDLQWVDDHLSAFKGRAQRDNWVAQARELAGQLTAV